jgi:hypothetical protein
MMCIHQLQFLESKSLTAVSNRSFALTRLRAVTVIDRALASPAHSWNLGGGPRAHSRAHELYRPGGQVRFTCPPFITRKPVRLARSTKAQRLSA